MTTGSTYRLFGAGAASAGSIGPNSGCRTGAVLCASNALCAPINVAVIRVVPGARAVMRPDASIVATAGLELSQVAAEGGMARVPIFVSALRPGVCRHVRNISLVIG